MSALATRRRLVLLIAAVLLAAAFAVAAAGRDEPMPCGCIRPPDVWQPGVSVVSVPAER
jgi:hypothetical protein